MIFAIWLRLQTRFLPEPRSPASDVPTVGIPACFSPLIHEPQVGVLGRSSQPERLCDVWLAMAAPVGQPNLGYAMPAGRQSHGPQPNSSSIWIRRNRTPASCIFSLARIEQAVRPVLKR